MPSALCACPCRLVDMGFEKMVNELDVKEAARLGMHTKPLTVVQVQKHLEDLGIEPEFGTHSHIRGLSGARPLCAAPRPLSVELWQRAQETHGRLWSCEVAKQQAGAF